MMSPEAKDYLLGLLYKEVYEQAKDPEKYEQPMPAEWTELHSLVVFADVS